MTPAPRTSLAALGLLLPLLKPYLPRVLAAILENYRLPDGSVAVPDVLLPYMRGMRAIGPK